MNQHLLQGGMKLLLILFVLAISLCACSSSTSVRSTDYGKMNEKLGGRHATIELKDGRDISAKEVQISNDSLSWLDASTAEQSKVTTRQLKRIVLEDRLVGGLKGMEYGALAGASFGVLYGIGAAGKSGEQHGVGDWIVAGIVVGGGAGAVVGFISGLIVGYSYEYELPTTEQGDSLQERK